MADTSAARAHSGSKRGTAGGETLAEPGPDEGGRPLLPMPEVLAAVMPVLRWGCAGTPGKRWSTSRAKRCCTTTACCCTRSGSMDGAVGKGVRGCPDWLVLPLLLPDSDGGINPELCMLDGVRSCEPGAAAPDNGDAVSDEAAEPGACGGLRNPLLLLLLLLLLPPLLLRSLLLLLSGVAGFAGCGRRPR